MVIFLSANLNTTYWLGFSKLLFAGSPFILSLSTSFGKTRFGETDIICRALLGYFSG
jgi:hypothetical protein